MLTKPPIFSSNIPDYLISNATPEIKWIMENMSMMAQKSDYLVTTQQEQGVKLDGLEERAKYTNSKIAKAILDIDTINKERESEKIDLADLLVTKRFAEKYLFNKWGAIVLVVFVLGAIKAVETPSIRNLFASFLS